MPVGTPELIIILIIALVIFGPKKLPDLGRSLGSGMREFKNSISGNSDDDDEDAAEIGSTTEKPVVAAADTPTAEPAAAPAEKPAAEPAAAAPRDTK